MRSVVQRVKSARVEVEGACVGEISEGLLVLLGVSVDDTEKELDYMVKKISGLRIFDDRNGVMNESILDQEKKILLVSQFTLYGDARKGNRPSYIQAAKGDKAEDLYLSCVRKLREKGIEVETGKFGADMQVHLVNDGPVTILIDSQKGF